jgi:cephalosporin hydroxylase
MLKIDLEKGNVTVTEDGSERVLEIGSEEAFELISNAWLRSGWDAKYVYSFTWMGRPIIQLPEDMIRVQEAIYSVKPDILIETGVAHGGSLVFYASLFKSMGRGKVIGIDVDIRSHNREALEAHELIDHISLIQGSSIDARVVGEVNEMINANDKVMVILDSNHTRDHVRKELELYGQFVTSGSYIVATDGIMSKLRGAPRTKEDWDWNNPCTAVSDFLESHPEFENVPMAYPFNEGTVKHRVTYWPEGWLRRI